MKIKSKEVFFDTIQKERAWRRKELSNLKGLIHQSRDSHNQTLLRAGVLLMYSHWEGYIKKVCEAFFHYMNFKGMKYCVLNDNFVALGIAEKFNGNFPQKKFNSYSASVNFVLNESKEEKFKIDVALRIDTKSNLNSEVLSELLGMVGVDDSHFISNKYHIDNRLLKYRNAIAHGERTENNPDLFFDIDEFNDLYSRINELTDFFENIVSNHLELESYKVA